MAPSAKSAGAILDIDLGAIADNWRFLSARVAPAACGAAVKADAYGLGAAAVIPALARAGCRTFFVATVDEGIDARNHLDRAGAPGLDALVVVLHGMTDGAHGELRRHRLIPVLNSLGEIEAWASEARRSGETWAAAVHVDTGMSRLGLPGTELVRLRAEPERLAGVAVELLMSHLACADTPDDPMNGEQLRLFREAIRVVPATVRSLANSSGIFLGAAYHFDIARPGAALFGIAPRSGESNPMRQAARLQGKILQVREIDRHRSVGYGATHRARTRGRIATVGVGYADGYFRALSNRGSGFIGERRVPLVGRVSMDLITFDVSQVPDAEARPGLFVELIGPHYPIDAIAADAGTIGYEILTALGPRYHRVYDGDGEGSGAC